MAGFVVGPSELYCARLRSQSMRDRHFFEMTRHSSRRRFVVGTLTLMGGGCRKTSPPSAARALTEIEQSVGGRLGVCAVDTESGRELVHRADELFAMCSTFKWVMAAAVLGRVQSRVLLLQQKLAFGQADLLEYAPVARQRVADGFMTVEALLQAAITVSDNTAANLLLREIGGPTGLTQFIRANGDTVTRLDRNEPLLNVNAPEDPRDTTSPRAMARLMLHLLCGQSLSQEHRQLLLGWMRACETGKRRLRAGFPADWDIGDKTGSGLRNAVNDVAIAVPPGRAPILVAAYTSGGTATMDATQAALARVASLVAREL